MGKQLVAWRLTLDSMEGPEELVDFSLDPLEGVWIFGEPTKVMGSPSKEGEMAGDTIWGKLQIGMSRQLAVYPFRGWMGTSTGCCRSSLGIQAEGLEIRQV